MTTPTQAQTLPVDVEKRFEELIGGDFTTNSEHILVHCDYCKAKIKQFLAQELSQAYQRGREEERKEISNTIPGIISWYKEKMESEGEDYVYDCLYEEFNNLSRGDFFNLLAALTKK